MYEPRHDQPIGMNPMTKIIVVLLLFLTVAVGFLLSERVGRRRRLTAAEALRPVTPRGDLGTNEQATIELFQKSSRSVVHITTLVRQRQMFSPDVTARRRGTGSGFVWDEHGHIVTNFHVLEGSSDFLVTFADQTTVQAEVVGLAQHKDLALLRVSVPKAVLSPIAIGESANLQVGQHVFAIGNPFGLDQTLTTGVISGLGREIKSQTGRRISDVVQTDAAINPGNSGGPLLDSAGRLIGVNTQIVSSSGASDGVGFAIPVDTVRRVIPQLILHQRVITPSLGIRPVNPQLLKQVGLKGVLVQNLARSGPAGKAGILPFRHNEYGHLVYGDLIVGIDGEPVSGMDDYFQVLEKHAVGEVVEVDVIRAPGTTRAKEMKFRVTLGSSEN